MTALTLTVRVHQAASPGGTRATGAAAVLARLVAVVRAVAAAGRSARPIATDTGFAVRIRAAVIPRTAALVALATAVAVRLGAVLDPVVAAWRAAAAVLAGQGQAIAGPVARLALFARRAAAATIHTRLGSARPPITTDAREQQRGVWLEGVVRERAAREAARQPEDMQARKHRTIA